MPCCHLAERLLFTALTLTLLLSPSSSSHAQPPVDFPVDFPADAPSASPSGALPLPVAPRAPSEESSNQAPPVTPASKSNQPVRASLSDPPADPDSPPPAPTVGDPEPAPPARVAAKPQARVAAKAAATSMSRLSRLAEREREYQAIAAEVAALERQTNLLKRVVRLVQPTVVHLEAKKKRPVVRYREENKPIEEAGSGVAIRLNGKTYIITNRHVIANASLSDILIKVADGQVIQATAIRTDRASDLALLTIPDDAPVVPAKLGNSDKLEMGDFVLAVGSPFGLSHSVTYGIVSAKGRRDLEVGANGVQYQDFIQTDAAINPGNSGGPLLNLRGEVVGINTAIFSASGGNEGIGFALPINMVSFVAEQLVERGRVARAYLGVHLDSRYDAKEAARLGLKPPIGAKVSGVTPNSPAAQAQIRPGDVILKIDDSRVEGDTHLINLVSTTPLGTRVKLTFLRSGQIMQVPLLVTQRSRFEADK